VVARERTNVRALAPDAIGGPVDLTVADLSFISLRLVLPALAACTAADGDLVLMVKPQFEVGRDRVGAGGVVRDPELRAGAVLDVAATAAGLGLGLAGVTASPLPGPSGNVEFFVWFRRDAPPVDGDRVRAVVAAGPAGTIASAGPPEAGPPDEAAPSRGLTDKEHP
jgi:23S rRNA (cytidine1920-2'-O)/16S rRNA (cytidine1409-2'-O)-methyltransferase